LEEFKKKGQEYTYGVRRRMMIMLMLGDPKKATVPPTCSGNVSKMIDLGLSLHVDEPISNCTKREQESDGGEVKSKSEESTGGKIKNPNPAGSLVEGNYNKEFNGVSFLRVIHSIMSQRLFKYIHRSTVVPAHGAVFM
jgi:hypothetical protein